MTTSPGWWRRITRHRARPTGPARPNVRVIAPAAGPQPPDSPPPPPPPVDGDRCTCGGVLTPAPNGRATCQPTRMTIRCDHCDVPVGDEAHHGHQPGCDREHDCWCDVLYCPACCTECNPGRLPPTTGPA